MINTNYNITKSPAFMRWERNDKTLGNLEGDLGKRVKNVTDQRARRLNELSKDAEVSIRGKDKTTIELQAYPEDVDIITILLCFVDSFNPFKKVPYELKIKNVDKLSDEELGQAIEDGFKQTVPATLERFSDRIENIRIQEANEFLGIDKSIQKNWVVKKIFDAENKLFDIGENKND